MKTIVRLALVAAAAVAFTSCNAKCDKFNAKEYAQHKTERLDQVVDLTDAQEKEVYALYLEQGKTISKRIKNMDKADCTKPACDKKAECKKADCKKGDCTKKADCKKAECKKADCKKDCATCDKKADCKKADCKKVCDKNRRPHHRPMVNPEAFKAHIEKLATILTPEQMELLKASKAKRFECAPKAGECCPTAEPCANK
jgi:Spy/CpxP family protein refolding chaperone